MEKCQRGRGEIPERLIIWRAAWVAALARATRGERGWKGTRTDPLLPEAALQKALPRRPQWDQHECPSRTGCNDTPRIIAPGLR